MRAMTAVITDSTSTRPYWMEDKPLHQRVKALMEKQRVETVAEMRHHYVIGRCGTLVSCRPLAVPWAGEEWAEDACLVLLIGGLLDDRPGAWKGRYTEKQIDALHELVDQISAEHGESYLLKLRNIDDFIKTHRPHADVRMM